MPFLQKRHKNHRDNGEELESVSATVGTALIDILWSCAPPSMRTHVAHTPGTHVAHRRHKNLMNFVPDGCILYTYNVPSVCAYLGVRINQKYGPRRFQRRVARLYTTKSRFCSSI